MAVDKRKITSQPGGLYLFNVPKIRHLSAKTSTSLF